MTILSRSPTSRTTKSLLRAVFSYGQFGTALLAAIFTTPLTLRSIGARDYGLWLASGEFVSYFFLLDFGVFAILPWLIARADGQRDPYLLKQYLSQALTVALALSVAFLFAFLLIWPQIPKILRLTKNDWGLLSGPLFLLMLLLACNLPLNVFAALLSGVQDVNFVGFTSIAKAFLAPVVTITLLLRGQSLYALAFGAALFAPLTGLANLWRARRTLPELMNNWPRPTLQGAYSLFKESIGAWLGSTGVQLMERSSGLLLAFLGTPALVPVLVCSSRLPQMLTQIAWVMPDSALLGLAQISGETNQARQMQVTLSIIQLNLALATAAACTVLTANSLVLRLWVGPRFFGGTPLNLLLAIEIISGTLAHALCTVVAVQGNRGAIGLATMLQGALYVCLGLVLTRKFSLVGLLGADLICPLLSTVPISLYLLHSSLKFEITHLLKMIFPLMSRSVVCFAIACSYGFWRGDNASALEITMVSVAIVVLCVRAMSSQFRDFPLPARVRIMLIRTHLL